ncbi:MAG: Holliday junction branch migration DNA helicase RuvB [Legionellales bacterium]|nr:Holliday junction branch migration DNA helicase RuvB [Legionellales bacterium]|tara:strand:- start:199 stop:1206 length:1008 start_codon:yes stop_codon:yes gene_type:complete
MIEADRLISASSQETELNHLETSLRPKYLKEYIGQEDVTTQLSIFIEAARTRSEALDHVLIFGPPGLGKTTLAHIIANEMDSTLRQTSGPALDKTGDLVAILTNLQPQDILFIDEIHRLSPVIEEVLYSAMEDFKVDIVIGEGPAAQSVTLNIAPFTLVGATTRAGRLSSPLRDRFGVISRLEFYTPEALQTIVIRSGASLGIEVTASGALEVAKRGRGTPRIVNRLLRRVRDIAQVQSTHVLDYPIVNEALNLLKVDRYGLDLHDRQLLQLMIEKFKGGPVGVESLAAALSEARETIEDVIEPYLIQQGFLSRTARGRIAMDKAYQHLNLAQPE